jgi:hypothetical protein
MQRYTATAIISTSSSIWDDEWSTDTYTTATCVTVTESIDGIAPTPDDPDEQAIDEQTCCQSEYHNPGRREIEHQRGSASNGRPRQLESTYG